MYLQWSYLKGFLRDWKRTNIECADATHCEADRMSPCLSCPYVRTSRTARTPGRILILRHKRVRSSASCSDNPRNKGSPVYTACENPMEATPWEAKESRRPASQASSSRRGVGRRASSISCNTRGSPTRERKTLAMAASVQKSTGSNVWLSESKRHLAGFGSGVQASQSAGHGRAYGAFAAGGPVGRQAAVVADDAQPGPPDHSAWKRF
jgi:hypothetical protein